MKLRTLFILLLILSIFLLSFSFIKRPTITEYPSCGGGYFTAPSEQGAYSLPCISADGRPTKYIYDNKWFYTSTALLTVLAGINIYLYSKAKKKK